MDRNSKKISIKTFKTKHDVAINKGEKQKMPLEAYYEHGGLRKSERLLHKEIFRFHLRDSTMHGSANFEVIDHLLQWPGIRDPGRPKDETVERVRSDSAIQDLKHRGFLERVRGTNEHEILRINPAVVAEVAKFVKSKK